MFGQSPLGATVSFSVDASGAHGSASGGGAKGTSQPGTIWTSPTWMPGMTIPAGCSVDMAKGQLVCPAAPGPVYDSRIALPQAPIYDRRIALPGAPPPQLSPVLTRQAQYTMPVGPSAAQPFPWLWVGLGVLVIGGAGYWYYTKQKG